MPAERWRDGGCRGLSLSGGLFLWGPLFPGPCSMRGLPGQAWGQSWSGPLLRGQKIPAEARSGPGPCQRGEELQAERSVRAALRRGEHPPCAGHRTRVILIPPPGLPSWGSRGKTPCRGPEPGSGGAGIWTQVRRQQSFISKKNIKTIILKNRLFIS